MLGVCLGHQSLVQHFGGRIVSADRLMHGKTSMIEHDGRTSDEGLTQPFQAGRYHSLAAEPASCRPYSKSRPAASGARSWACAPGTPLEGVQFHPESVLTPEGNRLLGNFLAFGPAGK